MSEAKYQRFADLSFDDFRNRALDSSLSRHEKVGFPDSYRDGKEGAIFDDIKSKLAPLNSGTGKIVVDIGPGCSNLPLMLMDLCRENGHSLTLIDSEEMLSQLPDAPFVKKIAGYYPHCPGLTQLRGKVDAILTYSVLHYVFTESDVWDFLDQSLALLSHGGEMLIGDVPNVSKRKRFFSSPAGVKFHQEFTRTQEVPEVGFNQIENRQIDDALIFSLLMRARQQGFDAYVLSQGDDLPMANRREDILIRRP